MRFLFVSAQLAPHLDWGGYLASAVELAQAGHEVVWASGVQVAPLVQAARIGFHPLAETGWRWPPPPPIDRQSVESDAELQRLRAERAIDQWLDEERVVTAVVELVALVQRFRPHVLATEMFIAAAGLAAEMTGTPFAVAGWPAHAPGATPANDLMLVYARRRLDRIVERLDVTGVNFTASGPPALCSPRLHVTYWSHTWFAGATLLPQTRHVGGSAPPALPPLSGLPDPEERPWVAITLGTSFNDDPSFFVMAAQAAARLGCAPIVILGDDDGQRMEAMRGRLAGQLPVEAAVCGRVPLSAVLPYTAAAIHHGGAGMTHALATHGVPQIVSPHAADQQRQALGVQRTGVGVAIVPRDVTVDRLETTLAGLLPDLSPFRARASTLAAELASLGGPAAAAELFLSLG